MLKKSQNYFDHDHGKKTKRILYIYVVLGAGKFFKVFVFLQKKFVVVLRDYPYRVIKLLLRFSIPMPREDHIFGWILYFIYDMWWITGCSRWIGDILKSYFGMCLDCSRLLLECYLLGTWIHSTPCFITRWSGPYWLSWDVILKYEIYNKAASLHRQSTHYEKFSRTFTEYFY